MLEDTLGQSRELLLLRPQLRRLLPHRRVQLRALLNELCSRRAPRSGLCKILGWVGLRRAGQLRPAMSSTDTKNGQHVFYMSSETG